VTDLAVHADFPAAYTSAFLEYVAAADERARRGGYELGREAVRSGLGLMDVADAHHEAMLAALRAGTPPDTATRAAGDFLLEAVSAFEMLQRGLGEAHEAAERERRHASILRQLSSFLADASLAVSARDSIHEILHLLAEQARELVGGACCVATSSSPGKAAAARAASFEQADAALGARLSLCDLSRLEELIGSIGTVVRMDPNALLVDSIDSADAVRSWLATLLTALDGRPIGSIHLFDRGPDAYTDDDEAVLVQLAQLGSAAIERVDVYARRSTRALARSGTAPEAGT
jgi:GAF domain-containing protein